MATSLIAADERVFSSFLSIILWSTSAWGRVTSWDVLKRLEPIVLSTTSGRKYRDNCRVQKLIKLINVIKRQHAALYESDIAMTMIPCLQNHVHPFTSYLLKWRQFWCLCTWVVFNAYFKSILKNYIQALLCFDGERDILCSSCIPSLWL